MIMCQDMTSPSVGGQRSTRHLLGNVVIGNAEQTHNTGPSACELPVELAGVVLLVGAESQDGTESANGNYVADDDRVAGILANLRAGLASLGLGLLVIAAELLLSLALQGIDFALNAVGLGLGPYGLRLEVGGNGRNVGGIDIDQRVGGFVGVGNLGNGRGASGFRS